jgi:hypothetical protein
MLMSALRTIVNVKTPSQLAKEDWQNGESGKTSAEAQRRLTSPIFLATHGCVAAMMPDATFGRSASGTCNLQRTMLLAGAGDPSLVLDVMTPDTLALGTSVSTYNQTTTYDNSDKDSLLLEQPVTVNSCLSLFDWSYECPLISMEEEMGVQLMGNGFLAKVTSLNGETLKEDFETLRYTRGSIPCKEMYDNLVKGESNHKNWHCQASRSAKEDQIKAADAFERIMNYTHLVYDPKWMSTSGEFSDMRNLILEVVPDLTKVAESSIGQVELCKLNCPEMGKFFRICSREVTAPDGNIVFMLPDTDLLFNKNKVWVGEPEKEESVNHKVSGGKGNTFQLRPGKFGETEGLQEGFRIVVGISGMPWAFLVIKGVLATDLKPGSFTVVMQISNHASAGFVKLSPAEEEKMQIKANIMALEEFDSLIRDERFNTYSKDLTDMCCHRILREWQGNMLTMPCRVTREYAAKWRPAEIKEEDWAGKIVSFMPSFGASRWCDFVSVKLLTRGKSPVPNTHTIDQQRETKYSRAPGSRLYMVYAHGEAGVKVMGEEVAARSEGRFRKGGTRVVQTVAQAFSRLMETCSWDDFMEAAISDMEMMKHLSLRNGNKVADLILEACSINLMDVKEMMGTAPEDRFNYLKRVASDCGMRRIMTQEIDTDGLTESKAREREFDTRNHWRNQIHRPLNDFDDYPSAKMGSCIRVNSFMDNPHVGGQYFWERRVCLAYPVNSGASLNSVTRYKVPRQERESLNITRVSHTNECRFIKVSQVQNTKWGQNGGPDNSGEIAYENARRCLGMGWEREMTGIDDPTEEQRLNSARKYTESDKAKSSIIQTSLMMREAMFYANQKRATERDKGMENGRASNNRQISKSARANGGVTSLLSAPSRTDEDKARKRFLKLLTTESNPFIKECQESFSDPAVNISQLQYKFEDYLERDDMIARTANAIYRDADFSEKSLIPLSEAKAKDIIAYIKDGKLKTELEKRIEERRILEDTVLQVQYTSHRSRKQGGFLGDEKMTTCVVLTDHERSERQIKKNAINLNSEEFPGLKRDSISTQQAKLLIKSFISLQLGFTKKFASEDVMSNTGKMKKVDAIVELLQILEPAKSGIGYSYGMVASMTFFCLQFDKGFSDSFLSELSASGEWLKYDDRKSRGISAYKLLALTALAGYDSGAALDKCVFAATTRKDKATDMIRCLTKIVTSEFINASPYMKQYDGSNESRKEWKQECPKEVPKVAYGVIADYSRYGQQTQGSSYMGELGRYGRFNPRSKYAATMASQAQQGINSEATKNEFEYAGRSQVKRVHLLGGVSEADQSERIEMGGLKVRIAPMPEGRSEEWIKTGENCLKSAQSLIDQNPDYWDSADKGPQLIDRLRSLYKTSHGILQDNARDTYEGKAKVLALLEEVNEKPSSWLNPQELVDPETRSKNLDMIMKGLANTVAAAKTRKSFINHTYESNLSNLMKVAAEAKSFKVEGQGSNVKSDPIGILCNNPTTLKKLLNRDPNIEPITFSRFTVEGPAMEKYYSEALKNTPKWKNTQVQMHVSTTSMMFDTDSSDGMTVTDLLQFIEHLKNMMDFEKDEVVAIARRMNTARELAAGLGAWKTQKMRYDTKDEFFEEASQVMHMTLPGYFGWFLGASASIWAMHTYMVTESNLAPNCDLLVRGGRGLIRDNLDTGAILYPTKYENEMVGGEDLLFNRTSGFWENENSVEEKDRIAGKIFDEISSSHDIKLTPRQTEKFYQGLAVVSGTMAKIARSDGAISQEEQGAEVGLGSGDDVFFAGFYELAQKVESTDNVVQLSGAGDNVEGRIMLLVYLAYQELIATAYFAQSAISGECLNDLKCISIPTVKDGSVRLKEDYSIEREGAWVRVATSMPELDVSFVSERMENAIGKVTLADWAKDDFTSIEMLTYPGGKSVWEDSSAMTIRLNPDEKTTEMISDSQLALFDRLLSEFQFVYTAGVGRPGEGSVFKTSILSRDDRVKHVDGSDLNVVKAVDVKVPIEPGTDGFRKFKAAMTLGTMVIEPGTGSWISWQFQMGYHLSVHTPSKGDFRTRKVFDFGTDSHETRLTTVNMFPRAIKAQNRVAINEGGNDLSIVSKEAQQGLRPIGKMLCPMCTGTAGSQHGTGDNLKRMLAGVLGFDFGHLSTCLLFDEIISNGILGALLKSAIEAETLEDLKVCHVDETGREIDLFITDGSLSTYEVRVIGTGDIAFLKRQIYELSMTSERLDLVTAWGGKEATSKFKFLLSHDEKLYMTAPDLGLGNSYEAVVITSGARRFQISASAVIGSGSSGDGTKVKEHLFELATLATMHLSPIIRTRPDSIEGSDIDGRLGSAADIWNVKLSKNFIRIPKGMKEGAFNTSLMERNASVGGSYSKAGLDGGSENQADKMDADWVSSITLGNSGFSSVVRAHTSPSGVNQDRSSLQAYLEPVSMEIRGVEGEEETAIKISFSSPSRLWAEMERAVQEMKSNVGGRNPANDILYGKHFERSREILRPFEAPAIHLIVYTRAIDRSVAKDPFGNTGAFLKDPSNRPICASPDCHGTYVMSVQRSTECSRALTAAGVTNISESSDLEVAMFLGNGNLAEVTRFSDANSKGVQEETWKLSNILQGLVGDRWLKWKRTEEPEYSARANEAREMSNRLIEQITPVTLNFRRPTEDTVDCLNRWGYHAMKTGTESLNASSKSLGAFNTYVLMATAPAPDTEIVTIKQGRGASMRMLFKSGYGCTDERGSKKLPEALQSLGTKGVTAIADYFGPPTNGMPIKQSINVKATWSPIPIGLEPPTSRVSVEQHARMRDIEWMMRNVSSLNPIDHEDASAALRRYVESKRNADRTQAFTTQLIKAVADDSGVAIVEVDYEARSDLDNKLLITQFRNCVTVNNLEEYVSVTDHKAGPMQIVQFVLRRLPGRDIDESTGVGFSGESLLRDQMRKAKAKEKNKTAFSIEANIEMSNPYCTEDNVNSVAIMRADESSEFGDAPPDVRAKRLAVSQRSFGVVSVEAPKCKFPEMEDDPEDKYGSGKIFLPEGKNPEKSMYRFLSDVYLTSDQPKCKNSSVVFRGLQSAPEINEDEKLTKANQIASFRSKKSSSRIPPAIKLGYVNAVRVGTKLGRGNTPVSITISSELPIGDYIAELTELLMRPGLEPRTYTQASIVTNARTALGSIGFIQAQAEGETKVTGSVNRGEQSRKKFRLDPKVRDEKTWLVEDDDGNRRSMTELKARHLAANGEVILDAITLLVTPLVGRDVMAVIPTHGKVNFTSGKDSVKVGMVVKAYIPRNAETKKPRFTFVSWGNNPDKFVSQMYKPGETNCLDEENWKQVMTETGYSIYRLNNWVTGKDEGPLGDIYGQITNGLKLNLKTPSEDRLKYAIKFGTEGVVLRRLLPENGQCWNDSRNSSNGIYCLRIMLSVGRITVIDHLYQNSDSFANAMGPEYKVPMNDGSMFVIPGFSSTSEVHHCTFDESENDLGRQIATGAREGYFYFLRVCLKHKCFRRTRRKGMRRQIIRLSPKLMAAMMGGLEPVLLREIYMTFGVMVSSIITADIGCEWFSDNVRDVCFPLKDRELSDLLDMANSLGVNESAEAIQRFNDLAQSYDPLRIGVGEGKGLSISTAPVAEKKIINVTKVPFVFIRKETEEDGSTSDVVLVDKSFFVGGETPTESEINAFAMKMALAMRKSALRRQRWLADVELSGKGRGPTAVVADGRVLCIAMNQKTGANQEVIYDKDSASDFIDTYLQGAQDVDMPGTHLMYSETIASILLGMVRENKVEDETVRAYYGYVSDSEESDGEDEELAQRVRTVAKRSTMSLSDIDRAIEETNPREANPEFDELSEEEQEATAIEIPQYSEERMREFRRTLMTAQEIDAAPRVDGDSSDEGYADDFGID